MYSWRARECCDFVRMLLPLTMWTFRADVCGLHGMSPRLAVIPSPTINAGPHPYPGLCHHGGLCARRGVQFSDPCTGIPLFLLQGHQYLIISVAAGPVGGYFASSSGDMRARIWLYGRHEEEQA
jgi:hypothetical protein